MIIKKLSSFIVGVIIGFVLFYIFGAKKEGDKPKIGLNMILYTGNGNCVHIHHWVLAAITSLIITATVLSTCKNFNPIIIFVYGFLLGSSFEDLLYKDFTKFNQKCVG
jgi:hypothetical protein